MNLYLYNCPNTYNYGSMMMGENFISYFNKITGKANSFYVETGDKANITRLINATGIREIFPAEAGSLFGPGLDSPSRLMSQIKAKRVVSDFAKKIDLVVVLGGDDFTEDYGWKDPLLSAARLALLRREGIKVVMLGQTMGPYASFRAPAMKYLLGQINRIYTRDDLSYEYLEGLGLKNISRADELALLPLAKQETKERTKEYIACFPSELIYRYAKEEGRELWIRFNQFMLEALLHRYPAKKLVLLAHVLKPAHADDRIIVQELGNSMKDAYKDRIIVETNEMYPWETRNYIQQSLFVVSSRMHPVISAIQCGIPAISLSYSNKFWGVIGKRFGLWDNIIDVRYHDYSEMKERFLELIDRIEAEYERTREKMARNRGAAERNIMGTLEEIGRMLK